MKRILLTGRNGQVGWELERTLSPLGDVVAMDRSQLDLASADAIVATVRRVRPDFIINAAAYTAVDKAESEEALADAINGIAPGILAEESKRLGALLVHYSTDYVFDGRKNGAYVETDQTAPLNAYGRSKRKGELAVESVGGRHLILRTSWVYGTRGHNFLRTMLRLAAERDELRVVADQIGKPTWSRTIAEVTAHLIGRADPVEGLFHCANGGETSWFGFTQAILRMTHSLRDREPQLLPITTADYPTPAPRPGNSRLDSTLLEQASGLSLPSWQAALALALDVPPSAN